MLGLQEMDSGGAILSVGSTTGCWILVFRTKLLLSPLLLLQTALQPINVISDATDALYPALSFPCMRMDGPGSHTAKYNLLQLEIVSLTKKES